MTKFALKPIPALVTPTQILSSEDDDDDEEEDVEAGVQRDKALTRKTVRAIQQLFSDGRYVHEITFSIFLNCG